jgi:hypothetical protein
MHTREQPSLPPRPSTDRDLDEVLASLEAELQTLPMPETLARLNDPRHGRTGA